MSADDDNRSRRPTLVADRGADRNVGGRPTKYDPDFPRQAQQLCEMGATGEDLAKFFQVARSQIISWSIRHPEFGAAIRVGREPADDRAEASLYSRVCGFSVERVSQKKEVNDKGELTIVSETVEQVYYPPDVAACFIWLKNRRPTIWRDRHELNARVGVTVQNNEQLFDPEWLASLPFDELQRLFVEEIALSQGVALLPAPDNTKPNYRPRHTSRSDSTSATEETTT